ncbi:hypothetical protein Gotur_008248 [Gossypium turneri]
MHAYSPYAAGPLVLRSLIPDCLIRVFPFSAILFFSLVLNRLILRRLLAQTPSSSHSSPILHSPG